MERAGVGGLSEGDIGADADEMKRKLTRMRLGEGLGQSKTDWARVDSLTDEQIAEAIANDPDTFDPGADFIARNRDALNKSIRQSRKELGKGLHSPRTVD